MKNKLTCLMCWLLFVANFGKCSPSAADLARKSDPMTDKENMADIPKIDHTIIPADLVLNEDPNLQYDTPGDPLNPNDFQKAGQINDTPFDEAIGDPIMLAGLFQGDIRIQSNDELFSLTAHTTSSAARPHNAINDMTKRWSKGVIPYIISSSYSSSERAVIAKAMSTYHQQTCLQFVPRTHEQDYIHITRGSGCSSAVGRTGGAQVVSLDTGCVYFGIVLHELMHAVGFWHEQSRADRDDYVTVVWSNIKESMKYNFQKYDWDIIQSLGVKYDLGSIMHYGETAFSINGNSKTLKAKNGQKIGQRDNFSRLDTDKINKLYECSGSQVTTPKPPPVPFPDKCIDSNPYCSFWAEKGECKVNPSWMNPNCQKSCGTCGKCQDESQYCKEWASRSECKRSPSYMEIHCKMSCGLCDKIGPSVSCQDKNEYCKDWADIGECDVNPRYMKKFCQKSCSSC